jgi:hypothetical protein
MPNITWKREDGTNISHGLIFAHISVWNRRFSAPPLWASILNDVSSMQIPAAIWMITTFNNNKKICRLPAHSPRVTADFASLRPDVPQWELTFVSLPMEYCRQSANVSSSSFYVSWRVYQTAYSLIAIRI